MRNLNTDYFLQKVWWVKKGGGQDAQDRKRQNEQDRLIYPAYLAGFRRSSISCNFFVQYRAVVNISKLANWIYATKPLKLLDACFITRWYSYRYDMLLSSYKFGLLAQSKNFRTVELF